MLHSFNKLKVAEKIQETKDSCSFLLEIPSDLAETYTYDAGQYLTIKVVVKGEELRRAYSIFTAPCEKKFGFTVKRVKKGKVSNHLIDKVSVGDILEVMAPEGKFVLEPNVELRRDHFFISGGSGITPVMSMILTVLEDEPLSTAYLLYSNRNEQSIIFEAKLDELQAKYKDQFVVQHILSQPNKEKSSGLKGLFGKSKVSWDGWKGRINSKILQKWLDENPSKSGNNHYYLCGPGGLIESSDKFLKSIHIDSTKINKEYFTTADLADKPKTQNQTSSDCVAEIQLNGENFELEISADKTVLEALLDKGKDAPYSCTSGACSTCVAKLTEGEVAMDACFALDDDEVKKGLILTCQSRAKSSRIKVDFDA